MWLFDLQQTQPVAHSLGVLAFVCVIGMSIGSLKLKGISLGTAGVLFAGILVGHFGQQVEPRTLGFVKELGLVLFVFTMGLQLGPGFFAALRHQGVKMNALASMIVLFGAAETLLVGWLAGFGPEAVLGLFAGSSVNIPALGAATQTLSTMPGLTPDQVALPALACAVSYPTAILCSIAALLLLKRLFKIDPQAEAAAFAETNRQPIKPLERQTLVVSNPLLDNLPIEEMPGRHESQVTISRLRHEGETVTATNSTVLHIGDLLSVVGTSEALDRFEQAVGPRSREDLTLIESAITFRRIAVTERAVLGKTIGELQLDARFGVVVTRITRADIEMTAIPGLRLQFGDQVQIVGSEANLEKAATALGNSLKELTQTHFIPFFIGIVLGVILGTLPILVPGLPQPVKLGLAGGPLIVALILGRVGRIGRQVWHMPVNTNLAFREFGIALFFAAVGLEAGAKFFATAFSVTGMQWLLAGGCITVVPLLLAGGFARLKWKMNFMDLSGLLAGSMTNPPALAFATTLAGSDAPTVAYATVYPLTTLLRILAAQVLAILLFR